MLFNMNNSTETSEQRFERTEGYLKQRLLEHNEIMPVKGWDWVTLLEIYWEWMDYLVKENLKGKSDLLLKWKSFLSQRNTDAIADLLIGFFEAKRRYWRDQERREHKRDWFALCKNYCAKWWWNSDEKLLYSFFSSYSAAERRIYKKAEAGEVLADTSRSLLQTMALTRGEMAKKEEEKRRKAEEKIRKEAEKKQRKEERARKAEENKLKKIKKKRSDKVELIERKFEENLEDDDKEVDPDYPKASEWWSGPTDSRFGWLSFPVNYEDEVKEENIKGYVDGGAKKGLKIDKTGQYLIDFGD